MALLPGTAGAASVSEASGSLSYTAATGEANDVTIAPWGLALKVSEAGKAGKKPIALTAGTGCWRLSKDSAACAVPVNGIQFEAGDGADSLDASALTRTGVSAGGGEGDDVLTTGAGTDALNGGSGSDTLSGGAGDDNFQASDGELDTITCGVGSDGGSADADDALATDCESVLMPAPAVTNPDPGSGPTGPADTGDTGKPTKDPGNGNAGAGNTTDPVGGASDGTGGGNPAGHGHGGATDPDQTGTSDPDQAGTADPDQPDDTDRGEQTGSDGTGSDRGSRAANAVPPTIPPQTVGVSASGVASVQIVCPPDSGGCSGSVVIDIPQAASGNRRRTMAKAAARRRTGLRIGKAKFTAKAGTSPVVPVRLSKRGRQRIVRGRRSRARITVTTRSAAGGSVVSTQEVTIRPRRTAARRSGRKVKP
jgi:RTX calcium-binding nonapeptide repeat (4 copies)